MNDIVFFDFNFPPTELTDWFFIPVVVEVFYIYFNFLKCSEYLCSKLFIVIVNEMNYL